jgi:hypothetical protein
MAGSMQPSTADRIAAVGHNGRVYVVPEFKLFFVSLAKNACTTMKWVIADLAREDVAGFSAGLKPYVAEEYSVHDRRLFKNALYPDEVPRSVLAEIDPDRGWFVFAIVRDPRVRLFSAWQDKLLLQDPAYRRFCDEPWYPGAPEDAETVVADFARFVKMVSADPAPEVRRDTHFAGQTRKLMLDKVPYSRIYSIEQMAELHRDLTAHVQRLGWSGPLNFRRFNDTPLRANAAVFADGVREQIEAMYRGDFATFGEMWDFVAIEKVPDWTAAQIREVQVRTALTRRLGDVRGIALEYRSRYERAAAEAQRRRAGARARRLLGRLRRPLIKQNA